MADQTQQANSTLSGSEAWEPYRGELTPRLAAHLYRRAGFGATYKQLHEASELGVSGVVDQLFQGTDTNNANENDQGASTGFDSQMNSMATAMTAAGDGKRLSSWWLYRMIHSPDQLAEKITLFWHGHFATSAAKVTDVKMMLGQHDLLRRHALSEFEPLIRAISRDPAMLVWLDSTTNRRIHPNENYAREIMELFCLGPGAYTEDDIKEVARAFTGWELRGKRFAFNAYQHDNNEKNILGQRGNFDGDDAIRIILQQPAAARFIAHKLIRYLVAEDPALDTPTVESLAQIIRDNNFNTAAAVKHILTSRIFYSTQAIARRIKSPVELAVGLLRSLNGIANTNYLAEEAERLGQGVFYPPNVKGWDGGRTWINSSTLIGRANLVRGLVIDGQADFTNGLGSVLREAGAQDAASSVETLATLLLAVDPPDSVKRELIRVAPAAMKTAGPPNSSTP